MKIKKILAFFLIWRIALFFIALLASFIIPNFGNRFPYANTVLIPTHLPSWIWGFGNFDGVHYLRIAQDGYNAQYSQAFFPLYPLAVKLVADFNLLIPKNHALDIRTYVDPSYFFAGLILSNAFFLLSLFLFYKLVRIDFNDNIAFGSLILLILFPTSFYFGAIYTESLFLFLVLGALYSIRKNNFLIAGVFSVFASGTRIFGLLLIPVLMIEAYMYFRKRKAFNNREMAQAIIGTLLAPFGTLLYMLFLRLNFDNPVYFLTSQPLFGAERSSGNLILLPQVIYRYIKIFATIPINSQLFFSAFLEFSFTIVTLGCLLFFVKKMRISYLIFTLGCLILPTLTGTFSSMPRYVLMSFLLLPFIVEAIRKYFIILAVSFTGIGILLLSLFVRGYWVA